MDLPVLYSGTSNQLLAKRVAEILYWGLGNVEITRFIDNECRVRVVSDPSGKHVYLFQSLSQIADQHLIELGLMSQAVKSLGASRVTAVIPWIGYSKQDKQFRKGEAVSAQLVAKVIEVSGIDDIITMELHSENLVPFFRIPVTELHTHDLLADALRREVTGSKLTNTIVVCPDRGGQSRSDRFAHNVGLSTVYLEKKRDLLTGEVKVSGTSGDIAGKQVVIFDDIINTGATAIRSSEFLKERGADRIYFLATHAVFAGNASTHLALSPIDRVIATDTVYVEPEKTFSKLTVVTVAPILAEAIRRAAK